jgi:chromosome segregation ATPase
MARPGITQGQVFEVAETLVAEGLAPTVPLVRERLGSGSFTTLGEHLRAWKEKHAAAAVAEIHDMPEKVRAAFQLAWQVAFRNAQTEVETQRQALEAMRREMEREQRDMTEEIRRLEREIEAAVERGGQLDTALAEARRTGEEKDRQLLALQINNARLEERVKAADERADVANDRAEEYQRQVTDLQGKLAEMARPDKTAVPPKSAATKPEET